MRFLTNCTKLVCDRLFIVKGIDYVKQTVWKLFAYTQNNKNEFDKTSKPY